MQPRGVESVEASVISDGMLGASTVVSQPVPVLRRFWRSLLRGIVPRRRRQTELISALNDVASAVSSTLSLDDVLETIVARSKVITNTEKAALVLTQEHSENLDSDTLVVRGSRSEHPEEWWAGELAEIAPAVFRERSSYLNFNREHDAWLLSVPISVHDRPIGLLAAINSASHEFSPEQVDFLGVLGAFAAIAIENARLAEQSKYVLLASERDRIAREMHDGIAQSLFSVALGLEVCRKQVLREPVIVATRLDELQEAVDLSRKELRRFIYDLRPVKLQELGLAGAIEYWVHEVSSGEAVRGTVSVEGEVRNITPAAEACLYRVAKESVSNVVKHSGASKFEVVIMYAENGVSLRIADDGSGFDPVANARSSGGEGLGLRSIYERVKRESGRLDVVSEPGSGTTIYVRLPV
ncbi:MAG: GAF domain-containing sensor histidine kinase [Coriobacteriia bacterium]|nr:GAF domain-containing sensor histidine kinase [Coriobacteriia bacterium]